MDEVFGKWKSKLEKNKKQKIVFAEAFDLRVLQTAVRLAKENLLLPVVIAEEAAWISFTSKHQIDRSHFLCIDPLTDSRMEEVLSYLEHDQEALTDVNVLAALLVKRQIVDGFISGASHTTAQVISPALQYIPLRKSTSRVSGVMAVQSHERTCLFADCSIHIEPDARELAAIAMESIETAKSLAIEPSVAFLSYTSHMQGRDTRVNKIQHAITLVKKAYPTIPVDGELQFDAAFTPEIAEKKVPQSPLKGRATIFVFPTLEAGNIACKIMEQMGTYRTFGPFTQGFGQSVHDLSRGCTVETIYEVAIYAAIQALTTTP